MLRYRSYRRRHSHQPGAMQAAGHDHPASDRRPEAGICVSGLRDAHGMPQRSVRHLSLFSGIIVQGCSTGARRTRARVFVPLSKRKYAPCAKHHWGMIRIPRGTHTGRASGEVIRRRSGHAFSWACVSRQSKSTAIRRTGMPGGTTCLLPHTATPGSQGQPATPAG